MNRNDFSRIMRSEAGCIGSCIGLLVIASLAMLAYWKFTAFIIATLSLIIITGMAWMAYTVKGWLTNKGGR
jgi:hypothetical protein